MWNWAKEILLYFKSASKQNQKWDRLKNFISFFNLFVILLFSNMAAKDFLLLFSLFVSIFTRCTHDGV